ncbi:hypothetical protein MED121_03988 [Marinomonas sp. MED121]|nr:hypothetical protein MED121_03988 [Marinomonas sp. MED121]
MMRIICENQKRVLMQTSQNAERPETGRSINKLRDLT